MKKTLLLLITLSLLSIQSYSQSEATYSVNFTSNWTQTAHPHPSGSLPGNAHWSKLVGATHNSDIVFLEMGGIATEGVENIAETGGNTAFYSEVDAAITANFANALVDGDGLASAGGQINIDEIITTEDYPLLTLLSMIAPSPDWMIAINSISLIDGNGDWIDEINIDLYPYDAGTDNGIDYTSGDSNTNPKEPISSLQGTAPFSNEIIGTITISLESVVLGISDISINQTVLFPNPANNKVTVSNTSNLKTVSFYNVLGAQVMQVKNINSNSTQIDINSLPNGIYLVKVQNDANDESIKRLVKL
ncbi:MAG: spondin domain-containing protein [Flavobacteriaceae bacterium]|nr:spondin domain-containing protein [Flavobacteriaceae bacterium]